MSEEQNCGCSVEELGGVGIEGLRALHAALALQPCGFPVRELRAHKRRRVLVRTLHRSGHVGRQKERLELLCLSGGSALVLHTQGTKGPGQQWPVSGAPVRAGLGRRADA